jgi:nitroimidazol reductase NimA-like FMN-containing flavoprotein (pyridoxamine 5'-phosphate oxidase superfamily)
MDTSTRSIHDDIEHLGTAQCWRLLEEGSLGRLAVVGPSGGPEVFPVNFLVHSGAVYFRSAPGSKLVDIAARPEVAFEIDGQDGVSFWSVVVKGVARRLESDAEIHESGVEGLVSASPTSKQDFIGITASTVTGRRFRKHGAAPSRRPDADGTQPTTGAHEPVRPAEDDRDYPGSANAAADGPFPIPHFPPRSGG